MEELVIKKHHHKDIPKGAVVCFIGARGSGKSVAVKALCYHFKAIPRFIVVSKTEKQNKYFSSFIPPGSIYYDWDTSLLPKIFVTQDALLEKYGKEDPRTHLVLILDDCLCDKKIWKQPEISELLMNGRHRNITFIFTLQYAIGITPELRGNIDVSFIYAQDSPTEKRKIFEHYVGCFDTFRKFSEAFGPITEDYNSLVVNRTKKTNDISKKLFRYKAPLNIPMFKAGNPVFWEGESDSHTDRIVTSSSGKMTIKFID